jgi:hypothetical protein
MADNYQHALEVYPSPRDVDYPPCTHLSALDNGDLTLEDMMRKLNFAGGPVIRQGDILRVKGRVSGANGQHLPITKDVTVSQDNAKVERFQVLIAFRLHRSATIS